MWLAAVPRQWHRAPGWPGVGDFAAWPLVETFAGSGQMIWAPIPGCAASPGAPAPIGTDKLQTCLQFLPFLEGLPLSMRQHQSLSALLTCRAALQMPDGCSWSRSYLFHTGPLSQCR